MRKPSTLALASMTVLALAGLAGPALAEPKEHKEDAQHVYVNLGVLGDVTFQCTVLPGVCLGGASGLYDPADNHTRWDVWIHDYVWNGCDPGTVLDDHGLCLAQPEMGWGVEGAAEQALEAATMQPWTVSLRSAGYARTVTTYDLPPAEKQPGDDASDCVPLPPNSDPESGPRACVQEVGPRSASRTSNMFGFCGQGSIDEDSGMVDPFDVSGGPGSAQASNVTVTKEVFTDGLAGYLMDCSSPVDLEETVIFVDGIINSVTCDGSPTILCVDQFPSPPTCLDKEFEALPPNTVILGVVALVGEIGWTHDETDTCKDTPRHGDWSTFDPLPSLVLKDV